MSEKITVIGAGAWGTTLSILLQEGGRDVALWIYEKDLAEDIKKFRENKQFLPGFLIPASIEIATEKSSVCQHSKIVIFAVPTQHLRRIAKEFSPCIEEEAIIVSASKGIEVDALKRGSEILKEEIKEGKKFAVISGPNLSKEIARGLPAATVVASENFEVAKYLQSILMLERFRVYTNLDVIGVELGGALKNVIAIASGVADGLNLGDNAKAGLLVRGIAEMTRLGIVLGAKAETFAGLSGIGDLIATCASTLSRNHYVGVEIARGRKLKEILEGMKEIAEGVLTSKAALALSKKYSVEMPIAKEVHAVLFEGKDPYSAIADLMKREPKEESAGG